MADEEDYSSLPLTERAVHKIWKVRLAAYDEMQKQFTSSGSESDGCFRPFVDNPGILKKIVMDTNVVAQETGISALCAFLEFGGPNACLRTRSTVVAPLVEKGLGSSRAGTKRNTVDALLWYIELDTPDPVLEEMIPFFTHRTPKVVAATANAATEIIKAFGAKTVSAKPLIPVIPKLFGHTDKNVRAEATALVIELYKWLGDGFAKLILPDLKPIQQKELEEAFDKAKEETPHQLRYLKSQRDAMERQAASGIDIHDNGAADDQDEEADDMMDIIDPVAVLAKVPVDFDERISSTKWKERKEALEELRVVLNVPKMENEDFGDIIRLLAKCMKDANIMVVTVAANCIEQIANGTRSNFSRYLPMVLGPLLERTKEKKASVIEALSAALDAVFKNTGMQISDIADTTAEYLKHKTPQVKIEAAKFLIRCLKITKTAPKGPDLKTLVDSGVKLLGDTQEPVRAGGQEILGVLMKIFGERAMNPHLDSVDDIKKAKINEYCQAAEVKAKPEKTPTAAPAPAAARSAQRPGTTPSAAGRKIAAPKKIVPGVKTPRATPAAATAMSSAAAAASRKRLAQSPLKPSTARENRTERFNDDPPPPPSPVAPPRATPTMSARGLTGRTLTSAAQAQARAAPPPDPRLALLEKELEQFKLEKTDWSKQKEKLEWKSKEEQGEKARLMQEINDLQLRNAQLVEDHTRDILAIKSKETQLVRAVSDVETARSRIQKLEGDVERLHTQLEQLGGNGNLALRGPNSPKSPVFEQTPRHRSVQSTSSIRRSIDFASTGFYGLKARQSSEDKENAVFRRSMYDTTSRSSSSSKGDEQLNPPFEGPNDNDGDIPMTNSPPVPSPYSQSQLQQPTSTFTSRIPASTSTNMPGENWRRAAEVTTQLKARIEAMKARQNSRARGQL